MLKEHEREEMRVRSHKREGRKRSHDDVVAALERPLLVSMERGVSKSLS